MKRKRNKLVQGVGRNDVDYPVVVDGNPIKSYEVWNSMLKRCYSKNYLSRHPSYIGCRVCEEWMSLSTFSEWFAENYKDGYAMDKDIIDPSNKMYCPEKCVFVPTWLNAFVVDRSAGRGDFPIGVSRLRATKKKEELFLSSCRFDGATVYLGRFSTPEEAHEAWRKKKVEIIESKKTELDSIDIRLYPALMERYKKGSVHI